MHHLLYINKRIPYIRYIGDDVLNFRRENCAEVYKYYERKNEARSLYEIIYIVVCNDVFAFRVWNKTAQFI